MTGEPGSGKTYTINRYVEYLRSHGIEPAITASTGIAATHIGGMTIHSWSGIGIKNHLKRAELRGIATTSYIKKRLSKAKVLIIDEISMLPPETLRMVEAICREVKQNPQPFGGMQAVLVGDFFQLPPIIKNNQNEESQENLFEEEPFRFAYQSPVWQAANFLTCYITEQYRQDDSALLSILAKIRSNSFDESSLTIIKSRKTDAVNSPVDAPKLYSHNVDVDFVNDQMLSKIAAEKKLYQMTSTGREALIKSMKKGCLSPEKLYLKVGASVMFTKNSMKDGYVNGTLGVVVGFNEDSDMPVIRIRNGRKITVSYADWTVEEEGRVKGMLTQLPLRLAWAITVHKSQGISLEEAVVDLSKVFEFGQGYVALSRVRRLSGIHLLGWNRVAFQVNSEVMKRDEDFRVDSESAENEYSKISNQELGKMFDDFIKLCGGKLTAGKISPTIKQKLSTHEETLREWRETKNIAKVAKNRNLHRETIISHLEELAKEGKIKKGDLKQIVPENLLPDLNKIQEIFTKLGSDKLSPVFAHFKGRYTYEQIKIARMLMK